MISIQAKHMAVSFGLCKTYNVHCWYKWCNVPNNMVIIGMAIVLLYSLYYPCHFAKYTQDALEYYLGDPTMVVLILSLDREGRFRIHGAVCIDVEFSP